MAEQTPDDYICEYKQTHHYRFFSSGFSLSVTLLVLGSCQGSISGNAGMFYSPYMDMLEQEVGSGWCSIIFGVFTVFEIRIMKLLLKVKAL